MPADCLFPDKSFSTAARFPVRAASRSSCSFPIADPKEIWGGAGKRRKMGAWLREWNSSAIPPFLSTSSYFPVLRVWRGNKSSLRRWIRPSWSTVPLALKEEKFRSAARCHHRANFLWPVPRLSSVTSLKLLFLIASTVSNTSDTHNTPSTPALAAWCTKWMGISNMAPVLDEGRLHRTGDWNAALLSHLEATAIFLTQPFNYSLLLVTRLHIIDYLHESDLEFTLKSTVTTLASWFVNYLRLLTSYNRKVLLEYISKTLLGVKGTFHNVNEVTAQPQTVNE